MKPSDCQINDLQRYFDRSWLTHKSRGVLFVRTDGDRFLATDSTGQSTTLSLANFEPFYPLGRAINSEHYENMGIYVGRKARQTARRSASLCHYEVLFCPARS
jgi:phosphoribosyl-dephospho-CoA transferase